MAHDNDKHAMHRWLESNAGLMTLMTTVLVLI